MQFLCLNLTKLWLLHDANDMFKMVFYTHQIQQPKGTFCLWIRWRRNPASSCRVWQGAVAQPFRITGLDLAKAFIKSSSSDVFFFPLLDFSNYFDEYDVIIIDSHVQNYENKNPVCNKPDISTRSSEKCNFVLALCLLKRRLRRVELSCTIRAPT